MIRWLKRLFGVVTDTVWPAGAVCVCCDEGAEGQLICRKCARQLREYRLHDTGNIRSAWPYFDRPKELVTGLKYECIADCAKVLADGMADVACEMNLPENTVVTWVPMPAIRRRARGIDHGRLLAEAVAARLGLPVRQLLVRKKSGHTQRGLSREKRMRNLEKAFESCDRIRQPVLLIDDVLTTGSTMRVCSKVLKRAGATKVYVLTATRVGTQQVDDLE